MNAREFLQLVNDSTFFEARFIDKNQVIRLLFCNMSNQSKPDVEILVNIKNGVITIKLELFSINQLDQVLRLVYLFLDQNRESASAMYSNKTNTEQFWRSKNES